MVPEEDAKISIFDTAVTRVDTVTESTRTFGHRPFKLERHIERLYLSLKVTRIDPGYGPEEMKRITLELLEINLSLLGPEEDYWIVHNISRGLSVPAPDPTVQQGAATVMITNAPMDLRGWAAFYGAGCHAVTLHEPDDPLAGARRTGKEPEPHSLYPRRDGGEAGR